MIDTDYTIQSNYLKKKVKGANYKSERFRTYIEDLVHLERFITTGYEVAGPGMNWTAGIISHHQKEYIALLKELRPEKCRDYLLKIKKEKENSERIEREAIQEAKERHDAERKWWISYGGRL